MWLEFFCWWCWVISIYSIQTGPVIKQQVFYIDDSLMKRPRDFNVPYAFLFSFAVSTQTFAVLSPLFSCDFSLYAPVCSVPAVISMPAAILCQCLFPSICFFASRCIRFGFLFISFTTVSTAGLNFKLK